MDSKTTVLIVDDAKANIISLEALLEDEELNIINATSGDEALKKVFLNKVDIILLDVQMPGMNGFEVAEILRKRDKTMNIPIIFITAISKDEEFIFRGYELGAVDYIYKPIKNQILLSKVKVFIRLTKQKQIIIHQNKLLKEKIDEIKRISIIDPLTGVSNRRSLDHKLSKNWNNCLRSEAYFSLLMIDIDNFKGFNDSYGHVKGDYCIKEVAQEIVESLNRSHDEVIRYGGEEFLVILPETPLHGTFEVAERIRNNIENLRIMNESSTVSKYVTVSIGGACTKVLKTEGFIDILKSSDSALYEAKDNGRNQVNILEK